MAGLSRRRTRQEKRRSLNHDRGARLDRNHRFRGTFFVRHTSGIFRGALAGGRSHPTSEWGLGGRRFGTVVTWFLLGGDLYTAYTFVAVPALMFGAGAVGFFAVPYTILVYPVLFAVFPRLWSVSHKHGYVTAADFVRGRFGSGTLALAIAVTGIVATMPYIALQLVGIEVVIAGLGIHGELPLIIAFVVLAAYTYTSGFARPR